MDSNIIRRLESLWLKRTREEDKDWNKVFGLSLATVGGGGWFFGYTEICPEKFILETVDIWIAIKTWTSPTALRFNIYRATTVPATAAEAIQCDNILPVNRGIVRWWWEAFQRNTHFRFEPEFYYDSPNTRFIIAAQTFGADNALVDAAFKTKSLTR